MIEDELRSSFARHEDLAPDTGVVRGAIDAGIERQRCKRRRTARLAAAAAAVITLAAAPAVLARTISTPLDLPFIGAQSSEGLPSGPFNLLLLGVDPRQGESDPARSDTVIVIHVPASHDHAYLVSIPRDTLVEVPGVGRTKLSDAHAYGGDDLIVKIVSEMTGARIDGTVVVTFEGLVKLTDAVGGVDLCLPRAVRSSHTRHVFNAGCSRYTGAQSLDLLRQRFNLPYGDLDRIANCQEYLRALLERLTGTGVLANPARANEVLKAASGAVRLDLGPVGFGGAVSLARRLRASDVTGISTATYAYAEGTIVTDENAGQGFDPMTPLTTELFAALRSDTLANWATEHPEAVRTKR